MTDWKSIIGSASTRRRIAVLVALIGVVVVASRLATVWPRNVNVAYEVGPGVIALDVDYLQDGQAVSSVRFERPRGNVERFRHSVRLQPGDYRAQITVYTAEGAAREAARKLRAPAEGLVRIDLREARTR